MKKILSNIIKKYKMQSLKNNKSFYEDIKELSKNYQGRGYAYKAFVIGLNNIFNNFNINKVELFVVKTNYAAIKLYEHLGFELKGLVKDQFFKNDIYYEDSLAYSISKEDFKNHHY